MAKNLPSKMPTINKASYLPGEPILAEKSKRTGNTGWREMIEAQHYLWASQTAHLDGAEFTPDWQTTDGNFTTTPDSNQMRPLDTVTLFGRPRRPDINDNLHVTVMAVLQDLELAYKIYETTETTPIVDDTIGSNTGNRETVRKTENIAAPTLRSGGTIQPIRVEFEARALEEPGSLHYVEGYESIIRQASLLP